MIQLTTARLLIRDHVQEDLQTHHELVSDGEIMWFLQDIMTHNLEESRENLQQAMDQINHPQRKFVFLRIENRLTKEHIGEIGYTVTDITPLGKLVGVGYFIRKEHWGCGYTSEALRELLRFAFQEDNVYRVSSGCLKENQASERVMQKCGLIKEADFVEYEWHDGKLKDRVEYRLLRREWLANQ